MSTQTKDNASSFVLKRIKFMAKHFLYVAIVTVGLYGISASPSHAALDPGCLTAAGTPDITLETCPGSNAYCTAAGTPRPQICIAGTIEWCGAFDGGRAADNYCMPGTAEFCSLEWNITPLHASCTAPPVDCTPDPLPDGSPAPLPNDVTCVGAPAYCSDPANPDNATQDICKPGHDLYCTSGYHTGSPQCSAPDPAYCGFHPGSPGCPEPLDCVATPADVGCPGSDLYCAAAAPGDAACEVGSTAYCDNAINAGRMECRAGSAAYCALPANLPPTQPDICREGTIEYCTNPYGGHSSEPICIPGHPDYCDDKPTEPSCAPAVGSDAYCDPAGPHVGEPICTPGSDEWCAYGYPPRSIADPACAGSTGYCAIAPHGTDDPACPGSTPYCADATTGFTTDPVTGLPVPVSVCEPGTVEFCRLPHNASHELCAPGSTSYCTAFPSDPLCAPVGTPGYSGGTPWSVLETSKKTGIATVLCRAVYDIKTYIGPVIATMAILILALLAFTGRISWWIVFSVAVGIAIVLGASSLSGLVGDNVAPADVAAVTRCLTGD